MSQIIPTFYTIEIQEEKTKYVLPEDRALNFGLFKLLKELTDNAPVVINASKQYMDIIIKIIEQNASLPVIEKHNRSVKKRYQSLPEQDKVLIEKMSFNDLVRDGGFIYTCNKLDIEYPALLACMYITTEYDKLRDGISLLEDKIRATKAFINKDTYINYQIWNQIEYFMTSNYEMYKNLNLDYIPIINLECTNNELLEIRKFEKNIIAHITKLYCLDYSGISLWLIKDMPLKILKIAGSQIDTYFISYFDNLEELYVSANDVSIDCLENTPKLEVLSVSLLNANLYIFGMLKNLKKLCIRCNGRLPIQVLQFVLQHCKKIETICLSEINDQLFQEFFNYDNIKNILVPYVVGDITKNTKEKATKKSVFMRHDDLDVYAFNEQPNISKLHALQTNIYKAFEEL
jgi:hypothetical protein